MTTQTLISPTRALTDTRTAAIRIAHRLSHAGFIENHDIFQALSDGDLPSLEVVIDGIRFLVTVEAVPHLYQEEGLF